MRRRIEYNNLNCDNSNRFLEITVTEIKKINQRKAHFENDDTHVACTQDSIDVVWDWNSPQAKQRPKQPHKRASTSRSPKIPIKRHPSNNHLPNFEKLKEELQNLRKEIAIPDDEDSLILSPVEEAAYKDVNNEQMLPSLTPLQENYPPQEDDLFNDSADEDLMLCTQRIESSLFTAGPIKTQLPCDSISRLIDKSIPMAKGVCGSNSEKSDKKSVPAGSYKINNDSFSNILEEFKLEVHKEITEDFSKNTTNLDVRNNRQFNSYITKSESQSQVLHDRTATGKVEFYRTQSFESTFEHPKERLPQNKLEEIERKRKEALAKLELKRRQVYSDSPVKCTPDEIERKRLQALAKREAKRQEEIIERKRQEALKRLELNRKKNATVVKSSLSKRL